MALNESILSEILKRQFINKSRSNSYPLSRYSRRLEIKEVEVIDVALSSLDESTQSYLDILFNVNSSGGSGFYIVSLRLINILDSIRSLYQVYKNSTNSNIIKKSELRRIVQIGLRQSLNDFDIRINCSCPDFFYRFSYVATINQYNFDQKTAQYIPAIIRNPQNKGSGCKHCIKVLTSTTKWQPKVITQITQLISLNPQILKSSPN